MHTQGSQPWKLSLMEGIPLKFKSLPWRYPLPARGSAMENQDPSPGYHRVFHLCCNKLDFALDEEHFSITTLIIITTM
jgi:hypothetical protein